MRLYGPFSDGDTAKVFDNADFGYTRVTVERPLRLRYQMTVEDKARFLDACPHLLDDVQAIDQAFGRERQRDWNAMLSRIEGLLHERKSRWKVSEQKLFRSPTRGVRIFTADHDDDVHPSNAPSDLLPPSARHRLLHGPVGDLEGGVRVLGLADQQVSEVLVVVEVERDESAPPSHRVRPPLCLSPPAAASVITFQASQSGQANSRRTVTMRTSMYPNP